MILPGKLRERVTIQSVVQGVNSFGEATRTYVDDRTVWASVDGISSRETLGPNSQIDFSVSHRVRIRYVDGLNNTMRLVWRGRTLEIVGLLEHNNRTEHELLCTELA